MALTVGSLFAGIGGLELGFERAGFTVAWQVEIDPFCRAVLDRHWPDVPKYSDIKDCGRHNLGRADWIVGGFPGQDISVAGLGSGLAGERSGLWREFRRIVGELGPSGVLVENVAALTARGFGQVLGDLADLGFDAEWSCLSACAVGAPHMRRRLFIVAYTNGLNGRPRFRDCFTRAFRPLQAVNGFESSRVSWQARLENPSELYRDADGIPDRMERNRAIGNAVVPQVAEVIARAIKDAVKQEDR